MEHDSKCEIKDWASSGTAGVQLTFTVQDWVRLREFGGCVLCGCHSRRNGRLVDSTQLGLMRDNFIRLCANEQLGVPHGLHLIVSRSAIGKSRLDEHEGRVIHIDFRNRRRL